MNTNKLTAQTIARNYTSREDSKITALKKLDKKAKRPARVFAYTFGSAFSLVAGTGMTLAMQKIGSGTEMMILGIVIGLIGFTACAINYPIYKAILNKSKKKYAFDIVELAREICEESEND